MVTTHERIIRCPDFVNETKAAINDILEFVAQKPCERRQGPFDAPPSLDSMPCFDDDEELCVVCKARRILSLDLVILREFESA